MNGKNKEKDAPVVPNLKPVKLFQSAAERGFNARQGIAAGREIAQRIDASRRKDEQVGEKGGKGDQGSQGSSGKRRKGGSNSAGGETGSSQLVKVGWGNTAGIRASHSGGGSSGAQHVVTAKKRGTVFLEGTNERGKVVAKSKRTYVSDASVVPKAIGINSRLTGLEGHEFEFMHSDGRHRIVQGTIEMGEIIVQANADIGQRVAPMRIISPAALGGLLANAANEFSQHRVRGLRFTFTPSVAATQQGLLAMYFQPDLAAATLDIGDDEYQHAMTHKSGAQNQPVNFAQAKVWEGFHMLVDPDMATQRLFNDASGEYRFASCGFVNFLCGGGFGNSADLPVGIWSCDYDFEFFGEQLSYRVGGIESGRFVITAGTSGTPYAPSQDAPVVIPMTNGNPAGAIRMQWDGQAPSTADGVFCLSVDFGGVSGSGTNPFQWYTYNDLNPYGITGGQGLWGRIQTTTDALNWTDGSMSFVPFADVDDASDPGAAGGASDGFFHWDGSNTYPGVLVTGKWVLWPTGSPDSE